MSRASCHLRPLVYFSMSYLRYVQKGRSERMIWKSFGSSLFSLLDFRYAAAVIQDVSQFMGLRPSP